MVQTEIMSNKRKSLCIDEKVALIRAIEKGEKKSVVGKRFQLSLSTVSTIWKDKEKLLQAEIDGKSCKKLRRPKFEDLDRMMFSWFRKERQNDTRVSGPILKAKAEELAKLLKIGDFKSSDGWLERFKLRHRIQLGRKSGKVYVDNLGTNVTHDCTEKVTSTMVVLCRLCLKPADSSNCSIIRSEETRSEETIAKLHACLPEMNLNLVEQSLMCKSCEHLLHDFHCFKRSCMESEKFLCDYMKQAGINVLQDLNEKQFSDVSMSQELRQTEEVDTKGNISTKIEEFDNGATPSSSTNEIYSNVIIKEEVHIEEIKSDIESVCPQQEPSSDDENSSQPETAWLPDYSAFLTETPQIITNDNETKTELFVCETPCLDETELELDAQSNKSTEQFQCKSCDYRCSDTRSLKLHRRTHEKRFKCDHCDHKCSNSHYLKLHIRTHTGEKPFQCAHCDFKCAQKINLRTHIRTHTGEKPYQCDSCDSQFTRKNHLERHVLTHTGVILKCEHCDFSTDRQDVYNRHVATHADRTIQCEFCSYKAPTKTALQIHCRTHTGEKPFQCEHCDYKCTRKSRLTDHLATHTGVKPFKCQHCDRQFIHNYELKCHVLTHKGEKQFQCEFCDMKFFYKNKLTNHLTVHTGEKKFSCDQCGYKCLKSSRLKEHVLTHTNEKPFLCQTCGYKTARRHRLNMHLLNHTGGELFKCELCEYTSVHQDYLKQHLKSHTAEKRFQCGICGYRCTFKHHLKVHLRTHKDAAEAETETETETVFIKEEPLD